MLLPFLFQFCVNVLLMSTFALPADIAYHLTRSVIRLKIAWMLRTNKDAVSCDNICWTFWIAKICIFQWRIQDGIPPGCKPRTGFWRPRANWRMAPLGGGVGWGKGARCSKWLFLFQITFIGIRLLKIALTLNWLVLNVHASSKRKFEMLSEKWGAHYSVNFMNNFGLLVWVPINRYYWVILGIIV